MNSRHCATCRWYLPMPHWDSDRGVCERLDARYENNRVHERESCGHWEALK